MDPSPVSAPSSPSPDDEPCLYCGKVFLQPQMAVMWRRDPLTGKRVHQECLSGVRIRQGMPVTRVAAGQPREADRTTDRDLPQPE